MSVVILPQVEYDRLRALLEDPGVVIMSETTARQTAKELAIAPEELPIALDAAIQTYDFGGDPDLTVDFVSDTGRYFVTHLNGIWYGGES